MSEEGLKELLKRVAEGEVSITDAMTRLRAMPFEGIECATLDHHREIRCGFPEVIFCAGKTVEQVVAIAWKQVEAGHRVLGTRASEEQIAAVRKAFPNAVVNEKARAFAMGQVKLQVSSDRSVGVVSAGTADGAVAEEAAFTLEAMGVPMDRIADVGVAGLHRLLARVEDLQKCCAIVAVAGMEGALPSVVGGLVGCPVFAVPTSVGYGASLGGLAALLAMMNSCAANVSVVNIDNGFGAAMCAAMVHRQVVAVVEAGR